MATDTKSIMSDDDLYNQLWGLAEPEGSPEVTQEELEAWAAEPGYVFSDDEAKAAASQMGLTQLGNKIVDAAGKVIATLSGNQTFADIIAALYGNYQKNITSADAEASRNNAVNVLKDYAGTLGQDSEFAKYITDTAKAVQLGQLTPAQASAAVQERSNMYNIQIPQEILDAQSDTLSGLQQRAAEGYTVTDRAAIQKALDQVNTNQRGEQEAIKQDLQQRGQYGSGSELVQRQLAQQAGANRAAQQALDIEAQARAAALNALTAAGSQANTISQQSFAQQSAQQSAQDQINQFNAQMQQAVNLANQAATNQTNQINQSNAYAVQNKNIDQANLAQQNALKLQQQQQQALASAAGNATSMYAADKKLAAAALDAQNQQVANLLSSNQAKTTATGSSGSSTADDIKGLVSTGKTLWDAGTAVWDFFSDEEVKTHKKTMSDDEIKAILRTLNPKSFEYNNRAKSLGAPDGVVIGVMAQDVQKTPAKGIVKHGPGGIKQIRGDEALSLALAALSSLNSRIEKLEE